ncbi:hypothetical protein Q8F55_006165 [Vanrija albida]|uniref:Uncharacterized protein n=1 Tax=Vanrija albida TaxID=181172 RepID=A0ABR3PWC9_9TREE
MTRFTITTANTLFLVASFTIAAAGPIAQASLSPTRTLPTPSTAAPSAATSKSKPNGFWPWFLIAIPIGAVAIGAAYVARALSDGLCDAAEWVFDAVVGASKCAAKRCWAAARAWAARRDIARAERMRRRVEADDVEKSADEVPTKEKFAWVVTSSAAKDEDCGKSESDCTSGFSDPPSYATTDGAPSYCNRSEESMSSARSSSEESEPRSSSEGIAPRSRPLTPWAGFRVESGSSR